MLIRACRHWIGVRRRTLLACLCCFGIQSLGLLALRVLDHWLRDAQSAPAVTDGFDQT